jgi:hypothetical protein
MGGGNATGGGSTTGGGSAMGGGSATGGGSAMGGGSATGGGSDGPAKTGLVSLAVNCIDAGTKTICGGSVIAGFYTRSGSTGISCTHTTVGACTVDDCDNGDGGMVTFTSDSAADLTLAGTLADGGVKMTFGSSGYSPYDFQGRLWNPGDMITLSAAGATVPAFSGKTITGPGDLIVTSPNCGGSDCGSLSRSADLNVAWTGNPGNVNVFLNSANDTRNVTVNCNFASSPGTISATAMAKLIPDDAGASNDIEIFPTGELDFNAGEYAVRFVATGTGVESSFTTH